MSVIKSVTDYIAEARKWVVDCQGGLILDSDMADQACVLLVRLSDACEKLQYHGGVLIEANDRHFNTARANYQELVAAKQERDAARARATELDQECERVLERVFLLQAELSGIRSECEQLRTHVARLRQGIWDESDLADAKLRNNGQALPSSDRGSNGSN